MWEALFGVGTVGLGVAIAYGIFQYGQRPKSNEPLTEKATREVYEQTGESR